MKLTIALVGAVVTTVGVAACGQPILPTHADCGSRGVERVRELPEGGTWVQIVICRDGRVISIEP